MKDEDRDRLYWEESFCMWGSRIGTYRNRQTMKEREILIGWGYIGPHVAAEE
jgi:hypothetical protein